MFRIPVLALTDCIAPLDNTTYWITGPACSGKTTFLKALQKRDPRALVLSGGQVCRGIWPIHRFINDEYPPAPAFTDAKIYEGLGEYLVKARLEKRPLIIDGMPRRVDQANLILPVDYVWYLDCPEDEVPKRMATRTGENLELAQVARPAFLGQWPKIERELQRRGIDVTRIYNSKGMLV